MKKLIKFPDFFIVGAQKCGTSTVHNWLNQDSRINLRTYKETHFFSTHYSNVMNWYFKQFPHFYNGKYILRGEVAPSYMFFPKVFERIMQKYLLQNPFIIISIVIFCVATITGLYGIINWKNINTSTIGNLKIVIGLGTALLLIGVIFLMAGFSTSPNPEFEKKDEEEE